MLLPPKLGDHSNFVETQVMRHKFFAATGLLVLCGFLFSALTGCITTQGPFLGYAGVPIPVSPYWQKGKED